MAILVAPPLHATRIAVVASALAAPLAVAAALGPRQPVMWAAVFGVAIGLVGGRLAGPRVLATLVAVAPVWQVLAWWTTGSNDFNLVMPWLGAAAGCLAAMAPSRWHLEPPWLVPVAAWALILAITWPVTAARELDFTIHSLGGLIGNGRMAPPPGGAAAAVALVAETQLVALLLFDWMIGAGDSDRRRLWRWLQPGVAAACLLGIVQMTAAPRLLSYEPWIVLGRATGSLWDANALGSMAALFGPALAFGAGRQSSDRRTIAAAFWVLVSLGAVLASGSRVALGAWATTTALGGLLQFRTRRRLVLGVAAGLAAAGLVVANLTTAVDPLAGLARIADTARRAASARGSLVDELWTRYGYGPAANALIAEYPWAGVGPGTFNLIIPDYARDAIGRGLPPDNAQNWWRHQWAELGPAGAGAGLYCSLLVLVAAWRVRRDDSGWALPILSLGLMSLVSSPVQHPFIQVLVGVTLGGAVAAARGPDDAGEAPAAAPARPWGAALWMVAGLCASILAVEGWRSLRPAYRAVRFHFPYYYGLGQATSTASGDTRWTASRAVAVFAPTGRAVAMQVRLPPEVTAGGQVPVTLSDRQGPVCSQALGNDTVLDCRMTVPQDQWSLVQIDVGRPFWRGVGTARAAMVTGRFEP